MVMKLRRSVAEIYDSITVEDAAGLVVFDYKVAVVLLVAGKIAVAIKEHFAKFGAAQRIVVHNPALGVHDAERKVVAGAILDVDKAVLVGGHFEQVYGFKGRVFFD